MAGSEKTEGLIHIYCGDGKGKTTAAIGLAVRAAGCGQHVVIARFLKTDQSGEVDALREHFSEKITLLPCDRCFGFTFRMTQEVRAEASVYYREKLKLAFLKAREEQADLLVLDEILGAVNAGLVPEEAVTEALAARPEHLEVVMTGRNPSEHLLEAADYVSEICMRRHPYTRGISARRGIEY